MAPLRPAFEQPHIERPHIREMDDALAEFAVARRQFGTARVELPLEFALSRCRSATALSSVAVMCSSSRRSSGARELYTPRRQEGVYSIASVPLHLQPTSRTLYHDRRGAPSSRRRRGDGLMRDIARPPGTASELAASRERVPRNSSLSLAWASARLRARGARLLDRPR